MKGRLLLALFLIVALVGAHLALANQALARLALPVVAGIVGLALVLHLGLFRFIQRHGRQR